MLGLRTVVTILFLLLQHTCARDFGTRLREFEKKLVFPDEVPTCKECVENKLSKKYEIKGVLKEALKEAKDTEDLAKLNKVINAFDRHKCRYHRGGKECTSKIPRGDQVFKYVDYYRPANSSSAPVDHSRVSCKLCAGQGNLGGKGILMVVARLQLLETLHRHCVRHHKVEVGEVKGTLCDEIKELIEAEREKCTAAAAQVRAEKTGLDLIRHGFVRPFMGDYTCTSCLKRNKAHAIPLAQLSFKGRRHFSLVKHPREVVKRLMELIDWKLSDLPILEEEDEQPHPTRGDRGSPAASYAESASSSSSTITFSPTTPSLGTNSHTVPTTPSSLGSTPATPSSLTPPLIAKFKEESRGLVQRRGGHLECLDCGESIGDRALTSEAFRDALAEHFALFHGGADGEDDAERTYQKSLQFLAAELVGSELANKYGLNTCGWF